MIVAECIKESYLWEGDGKEHKFPFVKKGNSYAFTLIDGTYWIDPLESKDKQDFQDKDGFIQCTRHGVDRKYFNQMFKIIS